MTYVLYLIYLYVAAMLTALPRMSRRDRLFGILLPRGFRESAAGKQALKQFQLTMIVTAAAALCAMLLVPASQTALLFRIFMPGTMAVCAISFYLQYRKLAAFAVPFPRSGGDEVEMTEYPDRLPVATSLAVGPYVLLGAVACWLYLNQSRIPDHFPVHFDLNGNPNGWKDKTFSGIYGELILAAVLGTLFLGIGLAGWFGSRRRSSRSLLLGTMIGVQYFLGVLFSTIAVWPILGLPIWVVVAAPLAFVVPLTVIVADRMSAAPDPDPTPDEGWKGGVIYFNRNDPALFVEKRIGTGWTLNLAHPLSWVIFALMLIVPISMKFLLH